MKNLLIYKASAGSGKTHILTQEYLKLAFQNPEKYKSILAVTFTNKAADEMKERILAELSNLYLHGNKSAHYKAVSQCYPNMSLPEIRKNAFLIRSNILHNYSFFSVSTIDSFVQKVVRSFSYEIGVHSGYRVEIETDNVLHDLTEILYKRIGEDKNILQWLVRFAEYKIEDGKNWDFRTEVYELGKEIFKERFQSFSQEIAKKNDVNKLLRKFYSELLEIRNSFRESMKTIGLKANKVLENAGLQNAKLGQKFGWIMSYLRKIVNPSKIQDYVPSKTAFAAQDGIENWYAKSAKKELIAQIETIYPALSECVNMAVAEYKKNYSNFLNAVVVLSNYHAFGLLNEISKFLPEYREENNLLLISDTTLLLKEIIGGNDAPFIYEKIGNRYQNILIDEFQDTSGFQWANFKPLIINAIAEGMLNLIVGDVKQSIYRWRGGDWKLLLQTVENEIGATNISNESLKTNWRSKKNIVDFNNAFFSLAPKVAAIEFSGKTGEEGLTDSEIYANTLIKAYEKNFQYLPPDEKKLGGRVKVNFYQVEKPGEMRKAWRELQEDDLPEQIDYLLKNKNYTAKDIAVLVRTNNEAKQVTAQLIEYLNNNPQAEQYPIISEESLSLAKSLSVRIIVSALDYLFDSKRDVSLAVLYAELARLQAQSSVEFEKTFGFKTYLRSENTLARRFDNKKEYILQLSFYEQVEEIIKLFELNKFSREYPYLRNFQDVILNFTRNHSSDLGAFLGWWESEKSKFNIQISEKQDAVKVVTIHKSKGLAFGVVLIPFADWSLEPSSAFLAPTLWAETNEGIYTKFKYLPVKYSKVLAETQFKNDYFEEKLFQYMDGLNTLYVAFTRPKFELIVFAPTQGKVDKINSVADLIFAGIKTSNKEINDGNKVYIELNKYLSEDFRFNLSVSYKQIDTKKYKRKTDVPQISLSEYASADINKKLSIKTNADNYFIDKDEYREKQINYGTILHELIAKVHHSEDLHKVLQEAYFDGKISIPERKYFTDKIKEIVLNEEIKDWFSDKYDIKTEIEILSPEGDKKIPDRLLISDKEAIVIDFKFGTRRKEHVLQVEEYKRLLSSIKELENKQITGFLYYAENHKLVRV